MPDHVPKLWATLNGADHNDVQGQPDCPTPPGALMSGSGEIIGDPQWSNAVCHISP